MLGGQRAFGQNILPSDSSPTLTLIGSLRGDLTLNAKTENAVTIKYLLGSQTTPGRS